MKGDLPQHMRRLMVSAPEADAPENDSELPSLEGGEYQPFANATNRPVYSIHFLTSKGEVRSFQYLHLDSNSTFASGAISIRFMGMRPVNVKIFGRNLRRLYDYIHQHRISWVVEIAPGRDFIKDGEPVVTGIDFLNVKDELTLS
jgi:hypothetical protein